MEFPRLQRARFKKKPPAVVAAVIASAAFLASPVFATCGSANCFLVTGTQEGTNNKGALTFDLSYKYIDQSRKLEGSSSTGEALTPKIDFENKTILPGHHSEVRTQNTLMEFDLDYGLTTRVTLFAKLPFLNDRRHEHFDDADTSSPTFTNTDGTSGFGDVLVGARTALLVGARNLLVGGLSVKLPTGAYRLRDSEGNVNEPTIQPGTGAFDYSGSLYYAHIPGSNGTEWFASASYRYDQANDLDYRIGNQAVVNAGLDRRLKGKATWSVQVNGRWTRRDAYLGTRVPSTGVNFIHVTPGLRLAAADNLTFYAYGQIPVFEHVNESNLGPRGGIVMGVAKTFY